MRRLLVIVLSAVASSIVIVALYRSIGGGNDTRLRIGVILPLTGELSEEGAKALAAVKLATEQNNENETRLPICLQIEDGRFTRKDSLTAFNRLQMSGIDGLVAFGTPCTMAVKDRVITLGIPMLALDGSEGISSSSKWIFEFLQTMNQVGEAAGTYAKQTAPSSIAVLYMQGDSGESFFKGVFRTAGDAIVSSESFPSDSTDCRGVVQKILRGNPNAIIVFGYGLGYISVINSIRESAYRGLIITDANLTSVRDKIKGGVSGIKYVSVNFGPTSNNPESIKFIRKIQDDYQLTPTLFSAFAYEAIKLCALPKGSQKPYSELLRATWQNNDNRRKSTVGRLSFSENRELNLDFAVFTCEESGADKLIKMIE